MSKLDGTDKKIILEDLKCPKCGAYFSFVTVIDYKKFSRKTECTNCLEWLVVSIEIKNIKISE